MKLTVFSWLASMSLIAPLAIPFQGTAQEQPETTNKVLYTVKDLGTLGGAYSFADGINRAGVVSGGAATAAQKDFVSQTAFLWDKDLHMVNLGTLGETHALIAAAKRVGRMPGANLPSFPKPPIQPMEVRISALSAHTANAWRRSGEAVK